MKLLPKKRANVKYRVWISSYWIFPCMYYAIHPDGRVQMTSSNGGWISTYKESVLQNTEPSTYREAVDVYGKHPKWD